MRNSIVLFRMLVVSLVVLCCTTLAFAQSSDVKASLFRDVDAAMASAKQANAELLTPKTFGKAMKLYAEATRDYERGNNLEDIRKKLGETVTLFRESTNATKQANLTFAETLKAREKAVTAESSKHATKSWTEAEKELADATVKLEDGDVKSAQKSSGEISDMYRRTELEAIKSKHLSKTWSMLETARKNDVPAYSPATFARAEALARQAETKLTQNRYDTDTPISLASEANYEIKHATYLATIVHKMKSPADFEAVALKAEEPLSKTATTLGLETPRFDEGTGKVTRQINESIVALQGSQDRLTRSLSEKQQEIATLDVRVDELETQLGMSATEKTSLARQMQDDAASRERFTAVERSYAPSEARVLREGNNVIIRLIGLSFESGKSTLDPSHFGLLSKVKASIGQFPGWAVRVQGHTDSRGGNAANLALSQQRAEAVRAYLEANMNLDKSLLNADGYGDSLPIASNETVEGRAMNRRIDIVIQPTSQMAK